MSKPRHASKPSRKRSVWVAAILLVVLGLVSAGFWFVSSQSNPQPAPTPTISTPATPTPTVTPTPEPTPTLNENEITIRFSSKGGDMSDGFFRLKAWIGDSEVRTTFHALPPLYELFTDGQTYIVTVSYDEPDGVPLITAVR